MQRHRRMAHRHCHLPAAARAGSACGRVSAVETAARSRVQLGSDQGLFCFSKYFFFPLYSGTMSLLSVDDVFGCYVFLWWGPWSVPWSLWPVGASSQLKEEPRPPACFWVTAPVIWIPELCSRLPWKLEVNRASAGDLGPVGCMAVPFLVREP